MKTTFIIILILLSFSINTFAQNYVDPCVQQFEFGINKMKTKDYTGAVKCFDKSLAIVPHYAKSLIARGIAKESLKDFLSAEEDFSSFLKHSVYWDNRAYGFYHRASVRYSLKKYNESIIDCDSALSYGIIKDESKTKEDKKIEKDETDEADYYIMLLFGYSPSISIGLDSSTYAMSYKCRAASNLALGRKNKCCDDLRKAINIYSKMVNKENEYIRLRNFIKITCVE